MIVSGIRNTTRKNRRHGHLLDGEHRQPEAEARTGGAIPAKTKMSVTISAPGRPPSLSQRLDEEPDEADEEDARRPGGGRARSGPTLPLADGPGPGRGRPAPIVDDDDRPAERVGRLQDAQEVAPLEAEQELLVVREPDELEVDAALVERRACESDRATEATSGKIDRTRMRRTVGQMNSHLAAPSERHAPSVSVARRGGPHPESRSRRDRLSGLECRASYRWTPRLAT